MRQLNAKVDIAAPPARVWEVLTDFAAYPSWNTFITEISGRAAEGERLRVRIAPPGGRSMSFRPSVLRCEEGRELAWLGRTLLPRVVDGEHRFTLEPLGDGRTRFTQSERFSGVLAALAPVRRTQRGFEEMNDALRARAEAA
jgi:hypothetical protein